MNNLIEHIMGRATRFMSQSGTKHNLVFPRAEGIIRIKGVQISGELRVESITVEWWPREEQPDDVFGLGCDLEPYVENKNENHRAAHTWTPTPPPDETKGGS